MKLSIVIPSFYPAVVYGGPIFTSLHTAEELAKLGIEVRVSTTNANMTERLDIESNIWHKRETNLFVKYYNEIIVNKLSFRLLFALWKDITNADIVHIQGLFSYPVPIALVYAKLFKKRVLLTPHGTLGQWCLDSGSRFKLLWLKWLIEPFNNTTIWHATAEMEKEEILSVFHDANVKVIANGILIDEFENYTMLRPDEFMKKFTGDEVDAERIIVSIGRLQKKKGFDILIDSFAKVLKQYPEAKLLIAGQDEGEKENLLKQIEDLGLEDKAFWVGAIGGEDKVDFLANADLFVLPSHNENFGIVYAESLAAGTPIVASTNTPWEEVEEANCGK
jgi:glycosyltransferase involved in cell wall biosynthesis